MKTTITETIEKVVEGDRINLENILIAGHSYSLAITNERSLYAKDSATFDFNNGEYKIKIDHTGLKIERLVERSEEDGGNYHEILQNKLVKGNCYFSSLSENGNGYVPMKIPFGAKIVKDKK